MRRMCALCLACLMVFQGAEPLWAFERPKETFYEKAGWLDHVSNTLRRVAERGERGAYALYKNPNPSARNAYESLNIHQANLTDLSLYRNSDIYRRAKEIRSIFMQEEELPSFPSSSLTPQDIEAIRAAAAELMELFVQTGDYYPIVTQSVLEVSRQLLPLQRQYQFFDASSVKELKKLYGRVLENEARCGQGEGYRIFCEGRADALEGLALLARTPQDAQLIAHVLGEDVQQPFVARELLTGAAALLALGQEHLLEPVLAKAVKKEGETFWQKIDVFMTGWWIRKIQYSQGRYLGNVTGLAVLPAVYEGADGNAWEELARLLYNEGRPTPASAALLARYGLGSCRADLEDFSKGEPMPDGDALMFASVQCRTLLPFLTGALASGATDGATDSLRNVAAKVRLSPAAYVARLYFGDVMGDLNADTELRLDNLLFGVFEKELKETEARRRTAVEHNRRLDEQIRALRLKQAQAQENAWSFAWQEGAETETWRLEREISELEKQKRPVPDKPDLALNKYTRESSVYRRKENGQKIYAAVNGVSSVIDTGLGIYYTLALPAAVWKGIQWGLRLKKGLDALRAGRINADVRRLAALAERLRKRQNMHRQYRRAFMQKQLEEALTELKRANGVRLPPAPSSAGPSLPAAKKGASLPAVQRGGQDVSVAVAAKALPAVSAQTLRRARLAVQRGSVSGKKFDMARLRQSAIAAVEQKMRLEIKWRQAHPAQTSYHPVMMENALRDMREYVRLEKDLEFYQSLPNVPVLRKPSYSVYMKQKSIFTLEQRKKLAQRYVHWLQEQIQRLSPEEKMQKAVLSKKLDAALRISDEITVEPEKLLWREQDPVSAAALRRHLSERKASGDLTSLQKKEVSYLLNILRTDDLQSSDLALLQLRALNLPFLQKSPNTLWLWGESLTSKDMLMRKTPFGFPFNHILHKMDFSEITPYFQPKRENVLFLNAHGYVARDGRWKGTLRQGGIGGRPVATFSADKVLKAAEDSQSRMTSVYIHSCQAGSIFKDLQALFKQYPWAAQRTEWFAAFAPYQPASSLPLPARSVIGPVRERLLDKLLMNITENGAGLGGRAWVSGREVFPLRASIARLNREILAAPKEQRTKLLALRDDLGMLFNMVNTPEEYEFAVELMAFRTKYPELFAECRYGETACELAWGVRAWPLDNAVNNSPFLHLKQEWVDYVADTAREMFALLKDAPSSPLPPPKAGALRVRPSAQKELEYAAARGPEMERMQNNRASGWRSVLLSDVRVRDLGPALEEGRFVMKNLQDKWSAHGIVTFDDVKGKPELLEQVVPDLAQYARLERQTGAAEDLLDLYNDQAGFDSWNLYKQTFEPTPLFMPSYRKMAVLYYTQYVQRLRSGQSKILQAAADRKLARAIAWGDEIGAFGRATWGERFPHYASDLRRRLSELGKDAASFSALQRREYNALKNILYRNPFLNDGQLLQLQNRIWFLPRAEKTSNAVFLWGDHLSPRQVWARKTPLGFFRPKFVQYEEIADILSRFKPNEENVLLIHVHGGLSRKEGWKGVIMEGTFHPIISINAQDLLEGLSKTKSAHNLVYLNSCYSGCLIDDVLRLRSAYPQTVAKTDWFTVASPMQYAAVEDLPAQFVNGTAREKLFAKVLQRLQYNGNSLGARMLVDGKIIYPLKESVGRLEREIKKAPVQSRPALRKMKKELSLLQEVADARNGQDLLRALRRLEKETPGTVKNLDMWDNPGPEMEVRQALLRKINPSFIGPEGFYWGVDVSKYGEDVLLEVHVVLKQEWVNYVADTARELFARAAK